MPSRDAAGSFRGSNVLITGGLGFIGSNLAIRLVKAGADVTVLDSLIPEHGGNLFNISPVEKKLKLNISDMRDESSLQVIVRNRDYIFHLAGQVSHGDSMRDPELDLAVNCVSTINLLEACRRHNPGARLVYTSTRQVYGMARRLPVTEDHPTLPIDVNGINKLAAEYYHLLYHRTYGIPSVVLRLTNTYGPRQQIMNDRQGFIGIFIRQALQGETIRVFGTGRQLRDFNYVEDVVAAILLAAATEQCHGKVFNLGSASRHSILELIEILGRHCPVKCRIVPFPKDKAIIDIGDYYGDFSRFRLATGWTPKIDLLRGMGETLRYYRKHRGRYLG